MDRRFASFYLILTVLFFTISLVDILDGKAPQIIASSCLTIAFFLLYLHHLRPRSILWKLSWAFIATAIGFTLYRLIALYYEPI